MSSTGQYFQIYDVIYVKIRMRNNHYFRILLLTPVPKSCCHLFLILFVIIRRCVLQDTGNFVKYPMKSKSARRHILKDKILQYLFPTARGVDEKTQGRVPRLCAIGARYGR